MEILATHTGGYPRIDDTPAGQALRRAVEGHQSGEVSDADLRRAQEETTRAALREQAEAGLDEVTDGLVRWADPVSHIARALSGCEIDGLVRFYDTNFYYRQPVFSSVPRRTRPILVEEYRFAAAKAARPVRVVLTGPYTIARLSVGRGVGPRELCLALARALASEVAELAAAGARSIQIDEPEILKEPRDFPLLAEALGLLRQALGPARLALHTYFGDAEPVWDALVCLPADAFGFDATYSPRLLERLAASDFPHEVILGVVDARSTRLEDPAALAGRLAPVVARGRAARLWLAPSASLEYLPRDRARAKLGVVGRLRDALRRSMRSPRGVAPPRPPAAGSLAIPGPAAGSLRSPAHNQRRRKEHVNGNEAQMTLSRDKLKRLGLELPLLPTTSVGSFPKPDELIKARAKHQKGKLTDRELRRIEDQATEFWIRTQEEIGIDILVDGEMYRGDMVAYFAETMDGFEAGGLVRSYGNRYYRKPIITGEVRWKGPITVERWKAAQGLTSRPVKGMLTGPYTIMDWCFDEHYPDRRACALALAREIRKEVEALLAAGARIIQIDEPALSVRPEELPVAYEAVRVVTEGLDAYFINHVCYGDFHKIYPDMLRMPVDNLDLEMSNSGLDLLDLLRKHPFTKDISIGLADVHSHRVEEPAEIRLRLESALTVLRPQQVWADPDCGLKTRKVDEAIGKLRAIAEAVRQVRPTLRPPA